MKKKVIFFSPNMKGIKDGINRIQPSLGVGYLAAATEKAGYEVFVRDTALEGYENQAVLDDGKTVLIGESNVQIEKYIQNIQPDVIGISVLFSNLAPHAHAIAKIAKKINPGIAVLLGGNHISNQISDYEYAVKTPGSNLPENIAEMQDTNIDYVMRGEGEIAMVQFLETFFQKGDFSQVPGLVYRKGTGYVINKPSIAVDLNENPFPARHLLNMEKYFKIGLFHSSKSKTTRVLNIMTSRGCPEKCAFCTTPVMWGNKIRWRNPKNTIEEIKQCIEKYQIKEIQFEDDTITANFQNLMELCDLLEPLKIDWCTPNGIKVNYFLNQQPQMFKRMKEAGCYQITLACESGVQSTLDNIIGKRLNLQEIGPAVENAKAAGLFVHTFWIVGFPGEKRSDMEKTIEFASTINADSYSVAILTPLPGTPIYRQVMRENLWWDKKFGNRDVLYRNSLIQVDGFNSPKEFEDWVNQQNLYLNSLIEQRDPERAKKRQDSIGTSTANLKMKQT